MHASFFFFNISDFSILMMNPSVYKENPPLPPPLAIFVMFIIFFHVSNIHYSNSL
jgi:hypothetical protein